MRLILFFSVLLSLGSIALAQEDKSFQDLTLINGYNGEDALLSELLLPDAPNIMVFVEYGCEFECSAFLKKFRKVLSESKVVPGDDLNIVVVGFGKLDSWGLARQRALKSYERYPLRENIESRWIFTALKGDGSEVPLFQKFAPDLSFGMAPHAPRAVFLTKQNAVSSVLPLKELSTENFLKAVEYAKNGEIGDVFQIDATCPGREAKISEKGSIGLLAMRAGVVASFILFFGTAYFFIRHKND